MSVSSPEQTGTGDRLVPSPVFVLSPMRSGSTLLRVLLNSHSMIRAPHEMHLRTLGVTYAKPYTEVAVDRLGLDREQLEYLLWDRILHRELGRSGKQVIVDKTPGNALSWPRLKECWPLARFVFLLRHPASIFASMSEISPNASPETTAALVLEHVDGVEEARNTLPGHTVRYEELVSEPTRATEEICSFLGVPWEPGMLEYGKFDHGSFETFIGDFTGKIRTGTICDPRRLPAPDAVPASLRDACRRWGYPA
ncbi:sulfotransferase [Streptosporangium sp. NPDC051023]|uniref:sulfotransferase family protein n=1 Tax=Streptosporangium sp. NPDC051023 TaxID=3155410 RepID=UPI00344C0E13